MVATIDLWGRGGGYVWSLFCCALLSAVFSLAITSLGKRGLVDILCHLTVSGPWIFLMVPWVGLQCVIFGIF